LYYEIYLRRCQDRWDQQIHNKLHEIHSLVCKNPCSYGQNRKEQVGFTRCRIGHGRFTQSYFLNIEERPECIPCNSNCSLTHILVYSVNTISDLFTNIAGNTILKVLKEIHLYTKI
jgi:hypothetical protein